MWEGKKNNVLYHQIKSDRDPGLGVCCIIEYKNRRNAPAHILGHADRTDTWWTTHNKVNAKEKGESPSSGVTYTESQSLIIEYVLKTIYPYWSHPIILLTVTECIPLIQSGLYNGADSLILRLCKNAPNCNCLPPVWLNLNLQNFAHSCFIDQLYSAMYGSTYVCSPFHTEVHKVVFSWTHVKLVIEKTKVAFRIIKRENTMPHRGTIQSQSVPVTL